MLKFITTKILKQFLIIKIIYLNFYMQTYEHVIYKYLMVLPSKSLMRILL